MAESPLETFAAVDLKDCLVVAAFPTTGSAASIAAQYLIRNLELPLVGHVRVPELSSVTSIEAGRATSAVRIYGGDVVCVGAKCPRIYLITTELAPPPAVGFRLAEAVLDWAARGGVHLVLALEGVVRAEGDNTPDVFVAAADGSVLAELKALGLPAMERALIGGITAHLLLLAASRKVRSGTVLVEASRDHPDGRAAAALIEALAKVVPDVRMDPKPLLQEAMALEAELRKVRDSAQAMPPGTNQFI